jgi:glycosyltransferase involved in cell wall biosynthesis
LSRSDASDRATGPAVVHVCEALGGGVLEVVVTLANRTAELGIPTTLVHGRRPETPADLRPLLDERVSVVEIPDWGRRKPATVLRATLRAALAVRAAARGARTGVVHLHSSFAGPVRLAPLPRGWRIVYTPHGYAVLNEALPRFARLGARALESSLGRRGRTLAVSETEGEIARSLVGLRRVLVVPNGVRLPPERPAPAVGPFVVAVGGRAVHHRRPDLVAEIAERLAAEGYSFRWIGEGPARAELERAGVDVTGWLPRTRFGEELAKAHAILHLSAFEGLPLALLEALATGRPVVASDVAPIREATGDAALLVKDADDAAGALQRLAGDPALREDLGARGRARVAESFTVDAMVERTLAAYDLRPPEPSFPPRRGFPKPV